MTGLRLFSGNGGSEPIGWWRLVDDITEYNRENEKLGQRAVINTGERFAYFELQKNFRILMGQTDQGQWQATERCPLEFFVMHGYFASDGQWVTKYLKALVIGFPSPFHWMPCKEPEAYQHRIPGMHSMVITDNDPPIPERAKPFLKGK